MIHIFNRRELTTTLSPEQRDAIATNLSQAGIDYRVKTQDNLAGPTLSFDGRRTTAAFIDERARWRYIFYVKKEDLDYARHCMSGTPRR